MMKRKWGALFEQWGLRSIKLNLKFAEMEFEPNDVDKKAAWELYIELLTRITTQTLQDSQGDEKTALDSVFSLFKTTRQVLKDNGRGCINFSKIAIIVLNQVVRPFTAKWHLLSLQGAFDKADKRKEFRDELRQLQRKLKLYTKLLADLAEVEDLTEIEQQ
jgi:hypothetical protein